jgi:hypothetical protein
MDLLDGVGGRRGTDTDTSGASLGAFRYILEPSGCSQLRVLIRLGRAVGLGAQFAEVNGGYDEAVVLRRP